MKCARCFQPITENERWVDDPCCGAPDCEGLADVSHYDCLPYGLQVIEDEYENYDPYGFEDYDDYPEDD